jgi:proteic killer suppression protein
LLDTVEDILARLDEAETPQAMNLPGYRLHPLKGELKGFWSVTVRANCGLPSALKVRMHLTLN